MKHGSVTSLRNQYDRYLSGQSPIAYHQQWQIQRYLEPLGSILSTITPYEKFIFNRFEVRIKC